MKRATWLKLLLALLFFVVAAAAIAAGFDVRQISPERIGALVLSFGIWAPVIYLAIYGQPFIPLPATILTLGGGVAFGPWWGSVAALAGATLRAATQFTMVRLLGRDAVQQLLRGRAARVDERLAAYGFKAVFVFRIVPNIPYDMQNYLFGFSKVRFLPFIAGTAAGLLPITIAYAYLGASLTDPKNWWKLALAIGLIVGLVLLQHALKGRAPKSAGAPDSPNGGALAGSACV
jgi:uncharacterized membrane protein YdjX (TVP38/TMEM64 family)